MLGWGSAKDTCLTVAESLLVEIPFCEKIVLYVTWTLAKVFLGYVRYMSTFYNNAFKKTR